MADYTQAICVIDSIKMASETKDAYVNQLVTMMKDILDNVVKVQRNRDLIILEDQEPYQIKQIWDNLLSNKDAVHNMQVYLYELPSNDAYINMTYFLDDQLAFLENELNELTSLLSVKDQKIYELTNKIEIKTAQNTLAYAEIKRLNININTCYYIVDNKSELKNKGIIKTNFLKSYTITGEIDTDYFTTIEKNDTIIKINGLKPTIISTHPKQSYTLENISDTEHLIRIYNNETFWKNTKYLIVMVK